MGISDEDIERIAKCTADSTIGHLKGNPGGPEWIEGFGTMQASEPTTICDVATTFSYITKETPALKEVENFLREFGYIDGGTYDEDGRWIPPCLQRKRQSYGSSFIPKEKTNDADAIQVLRWNLWDAHVEYRRCCLEVSRRLREIHDKLEEEQK